MSAPASPPEPPACCICGEAMAEVFRAVLLGKYEAPYDHCATCGFLQARALRR